MSVKSSLITQFYWLVERKKLLVFVLLVNLFILIFGYLISKNASFAKALQSFENASYMFTVARLILEIYIYLNWRKFVGLLRVAFQLKNRTTWLVLRLKKVFFWFFIFDFITFVLLTFI